jgi:soluble lytic murein transglycosylase-like protein
MRMNRAIRLRRAFVATLILTAIMAFPVAQASALTTTGARYTYTPEKICAIDWRDGRSEVKQLIRCAANHWDVSVTKALAIADRESNYRPRAYNDWSCAKGIYQHLCKYWPDRAFDYGFKDWSAFNARANIIVTMKMVKRYGWGPWGG